MISELLKNSLPQYEITLPESQQKFTFRPMTVKEEKTLLLAQQTESIKQVVLAVTNIIKNCFGIENPEKLSIADAEKAFLELRAKSIGEIVPLIVKSENEKISIDMDLEKFEFEEKSNKNNKIKLNDNMILILKNPEFKYLSIIDEKDDDNLKKLFEYCFVELQTKNNVYKKETVSSEDLKTFYDYMTREQLLKFYEFVDSIPRMKQIINYTTKEGQQQNLTVRGIESFFVYASVI